MSKLPTHVSAAGLGDLLGLSSRRVNMLTEAGVFARGADGFEIRASIRAYVGHVRDQIRPETLVDAQARLTGAKAAIAEMQRDRMRGELVPVDVVGRMVADEYAATRAKLLALPGKLAPLLAIETGEAALRAVVERGITDALAELSADAERVLADCAKELAPAN